MAAFLSIGAAQARAQDSVHLHDAGPGQPGHILEAALSRKHIVLSNGTDTLSLPVGHVYVSTVIVLAHHVTIASEVRGDVIVVGGDAFVHPGANVAGRVIAIGGGAYGSMLGQVDGGLLSFRDETFDVTRTANGFALDYRTTAEVPDDGVTLGGLYGFRTPTYDRSNGLSVPFSPQIQADSGRIELAPEATYRSQLGVIDPSISGQYQPTRRTRLTALAERGTLTNDGWIKSNVANSLVVLGVGDDSRNWYRADRGSLELHQLWDGAAWSFEPYVGGLIERGWSVRPDSTATGGPWSLFGRHSEQDMLRANPAILPGTISSILTGAVANWNDGGTVAMVAANVEFAGHAPVAIPSAGGPLTDAEFTQATIQATLTVPTVGPQQYHLEIHAVGTDGAAPPQRWAYLGGSGTLGTLNMLALGGDQLLFIDNRYDIPITAISVPLVGSPVISPRYVVGSAGVGHLPGLTQIVGLRLSLTPVEGEALWDATNRRFTLSADFSFVR